MNRATEFRLRLLILEKLPAAVQQQILTAHKEINEEGSDLADLLLLMERLWQDASNDISGEPLTISPELIAQQTLSALRPGRS